MEKESMPWQNRTAQMEAAWGEYCRKPRPNKEDFAALMDTLGETAKVFEAEKEHTHDLLEALIRLHQITIQAKFYETDGKVEKTRSLSPKAKKLHKERISAYREELGTEEKTGFLHKIFRKF